MEDDFIPPPTLADIAAEGIGVSCACLQCHADAVIPIEDVIRRFRPETRFPAIFRHFKCSSCGSRDVDVRPDWSSKNSFRAPGSGNVR